MITFDWQIASMPAYTQINGKSDVVFEVNWKCRAQDGLFSATSFGTVLVTYVEGSPFTPYNQLTEEQVWNWINPKINRSDIEVNLQAMIEEQKTPSVITSTLPWAETQTA